MPTQKRWHVSLAGKGEMSEVRRCQQVHAQRRRHARHPAGPSLRAGEHGGATLVATLRTAGLAGTLLAKIASPLTCANAPDHAHRPTLGDLLSARSLLTLRIAEAVPFVGPRGQCPTSAPDSPAAGLGTRTREGRSGWLTTDGRSGLRTWGQSSRDCCCFAPLRRAPGPGVGTLLHRPH